MTQVRVTIDTSPIIQAAINILNRAGEDWFAESYKLTPVRKPNSKTDQAGSRSPQFPVRLIGTARGLSSSQVIERRNLAALTPKERATYIENLRGFKERGRVAKLFRYADGPNKGKSPEVVTTRGRRIAGADVTHGGTLRAGLELIPAKVEGNLVTIILQNKVPYAAAQEMGFKHKGTGQIPGRRFMRGPRDQKILPGLREGNYNRG